VSEWPELYQAGAARLQGCGPGAREMRPRLRRPTPLLPFNFLVLLYCAQQEATVVIGPCLGRVPHLSPTQPYKHERAEVGARPLSG
jgi:hypothetical protein